MAKRLSKREMLQHCEELGPEDGVDPRELIQRIATTKRDRKALQLCRQVERTLSLVITGELNEDRLRDLQLLSVVPAPHSNHLLVTLHTEDAVSAEQLFELDRLLFSHKGTLRQAIARDINRRKTPDITLRVVNPPGGLS